MITFLNYQNKPVFACYPCGSNLFNKDFSVITWQYKPFLPLLEFRLCRSCRDKIINEKTAEKMRKKINRQLDVEISKYIRKLLGGHYAQ